MSEGFPEITVDKYHIDILAARFVMNPDWFDVVVASNLFGDILSDLGPACTGSIGIAPSGNINPEHTYPSLFEPIHGSAPDIAGQGIANPIGQIWAGTMMLDHLGETTAAASVIDGMESVLAQGTDGLTPDMSGMSTTQELGQAVAGALTGVAGHSGVTSETRPCGASNGDAGGVLSSTGAELYSFQRRSRSTVGKPK